MVPFTDWFVFTLGNVLFRKYSSISENFNKTLYRLFNLNKFELKFVI